MLACRRPSGVVAAGHVLGWTVGVALDVGQGDLDGEPLHRRAAAPIVAGHLVRKRELDHVVDVPGVTPWPGPSTASARPGIGSRTSMSTNAALSSMVLRSTCPSLPPLPSVVVLVYVVSRSTGSPKQRSVTARM